MITKYIFERIRDFCMANQEFLESLICSVGLFALDVFFLLFLVGFFLVLVLYVKEEVLGIKRKSDDE